MSSQRFTAEELAAWNGFLRSHALLTRHLDAQLREQVGLGLGQFDVRLTRRRRR